MDSLLTTATSVATPEPPEPERDENNGGPPAPSTSSPEYISNNNYMQELLVQLTSLIRISKTWFISLCLAATFMPGTIFWMKTLKKFFSMASGIDWAGRQNYISDLNTGYTGIGREKIFLSSPRSTTYPRRLSPIPLRDGALQPLFLTAFGKRRKRSPSSSTVIFRGNQAFYPMAQDDAYDSKLLDALSQLESEDSLVVRGREYNVIQSVNESTGWKICQLSPGNSCKTKWGEPVRHPNAAALPIGVPPDAQLHPFPVHHHPPSAG